MTIPVPFWKRNTNQQRKTCTTHPADAACVLVLCISSFTIQVSADTVEKAPQLDYSGYLKNETAYRLQEPRSYTKIRNIIYLKSRLKDEGKAELHLAGRAYYDAVYDLFEYDTISARSRRDIEQPLAFIEGLPQKKDSPVAEIRELYLDVFSSNADLRVGKQFIVWGVLTGIRIVDEINPLNFRELITPELLDYRESLWSARLDIYHDSSTYEFIAIPELKFHIPAPQGSEWELFQEVPGTTYPQTQRPENWEFGARMSRLIDTYDFSFSYFQTWDDFPVLFRKHEVPLTGVSPPPEFFPRYERMHILGSTVQHLIGNNLFKAEVAYVIGKYFGLSSIVDRNHDGFLDHQGVLKRNHLRYGVGVDFNVWQTDFSLIATQWYIFDYDEFLIQDQQDSTFNVFIRKTVPERNGVFELLGIYLLNLDEVYLKPKFSFRPSTNFQIGIGLDLFYGEKSHLGVIAVQGKPTELQLVTQSSQFIGNFNKNDRAFVEFKYSF